MNKIKNYDFNLYTLPKVFSYSKFRNTVCFSVRFLNNCEITKMSLKYIKYSNYNKTRTIKVLET